MGVWNYGQPERSRAIHRCTVLILVANTCVGLSLHQLTLGPTHPHWGVALKVTPVISHLIASGCKGVETAFNLVLLEGELWMVVC